MFDFMTAMKALSDPNRVRILCVLVGQELCVCQLIEMLGLAPSTVSKHLAVLRQARLLEDRKEGRWMYYRHPDRPSPLAKDILKLLRSSLSADELIQVDRERVQKILCMDKEELCRTQMQKKG